MSANIFGEHFASVKEPAWHKVGTVLDKAPESAVEALDIAGLDYLIHKLNLFARMPDNHRKTIGIDQYVLAREPDPVYDTETGSQ